MGFFSRKGKEEAKKSRHVYKKEVKFEDGSVIRMGSVRFGEKIPDAKPVQKRK